MAQHDYVIANQSGASFRADLNNALAAIVSNNSGATAPSTTYAYQWWADTTAGQLKLRNAANDGWIVIQELDGTMLMEDGSAASPGLAFASDLDTGFFRAGTNQLGIATNGTVRLTATTTAITSALPVDVLLGSASTPSYTFTGDLNTGIYSPGADQIAIATGGTGRLFVDASGRLGVGITSPGALFDLAANNDGATGTTANNTFRFTDLDTNTAADQPIGKIEWYSADASSPGARAVSYILSAAAGGNSGGDIRFGVSANAGTASEAARIDSSGRLLVGTSSAQLDYFGSSSGYNGKVQITQNAWAGVAQFHNWSNDANLNSLGGTQVYLSRSKSGTVGTHTALADGNDIGSLVFNASDGSNFRTAALIKAACDGGVSTGDVPGRLVFSTTADGASSPTERMRIKNDGEVQIGTTSSVLGSANKLSVLGISGFEVDANVIAVFNRATNDGNLLAFYQAGSQEGTISVSGTTVSYNGAHLSRWSQLSSGAERIEILRGSVLSNIDEMCEWGDEENEQLNRMKVSDVEGDKNVSGVFQAWDDDDDTYTNDFYCAMTGDFVIRIAQGVTVERGDLLMSAGDGTAKPQEDDIIRSKTIAKVTSTNVSCTYDDGSYCVPCVLMAC